MSRKRPLQVRRQLQSAEAPDIVASWGAASSAPTVADALARFAELGWRSEDRRYKFKSKFKSNGGTPALRPRRHPLHY